MPLFGLASTSGIMKTAKRILDSRGASDVTPDAVDWDAVQFEDDCANAIIYWNNAVQITGIDTAITLKLTWSNGDLSQIGYKKSTSYFGGNNTSTAGTPDWEYYGYTAISNNGTITDVNNGDYIGFMANIFPYTTVTISVLNASDSDTLLDTFNHLYAGDVCSGPGCYLTTAVVHYKGLSDSGPELTAMRMLREHYIDMDGYESIIQEYYDNSPVIINAIGNDTQVYEEIFNSVKLCQGFVEIFNWQAAHDEYMRLYNDLKERYLP